MRKLFWQISTTLDGYMEDLERSLELTAQVKDEEFDAYGSRMLESIDAFVIGRRTYELFVSYWPNASGRDADIMNSLPKYVVSTTLEQVTWNNGHLVREDIYKKFEELKRREGRDIAIFGSATLAASLLEMDLIDECRIMITPYLLGKGNQTFKPSGTSRSLNLTTLERWRSGIAFVTYTVVRN